MNVYLILIECLRSLIACLCLFLLSVKICKAFVVLFLFRGHSQTTTPVFFRCSGLERVSLPCLSIIGGMGASCISPCVFITLFCHLRACTQHAGSLSQSAYRTCRGYEATLLRPGTCFPYPASGLLLSVFQMLRGRGHLPSMCRCAQLARAFITYLHLRLATLLTSSLLCYRPLLALPALFFPFFSSFLSASPSLVPQIATESPVSIGAPSSFCSRSPSFSSCAPAAFFSAEESSHHTHGSSVLPTYLATPLKLIVRVFPYLHTRFYPCFYQRPDHSSTSSFSSPLSVPSFL